MNTFIALSMILGQWSTTPVEKSQWLVEPSQWHFEVEKKSKIDDSKPYVLFVGIEPYKIGEFQTIRDDGAYDRTGVYYITSKQCHRINHDDVLASIRQIESQPAAIPFVGSGKLKIVLPEFQRQEDDSRGPWLGPVDQERIRKLWPKNVSSDGMRFYRPTQHSQRIAITDERPSLRWYHLTQHDHFGNAPTMFNPNTVKPEWAAPGGLYGVRGWTSYTAAYLPEDPKVWKQPLPIANGGMIPGYKWSYPVGSTFAGLLVRDGRAFELRIR